MIRQQEAIRRANVYKALKQRITHKPYNKKTKTIFEEIATTFGYEPRSVSNIFYAMRKEEEKQLGQIRASKKLGAEIARWFVVNITKWHELTLDSESQSYLEQKFYINENPDKDGYSFDFYIEASYRIEKFGNGKDSPVDEIININSYYVQLTAVYNSEGEEIILQQKYIQEIEDHLYSMLKLKINYRGVIM